MDLRKINTNGKPSREKYTRVDFVAEFPRSALPANPTDAELEPFGLVNVVPTVAPEPVNPLLEVYEEVDPIFEDGKWRQAWASRPPTQSEIQAISAQIIATFSNAAQVRLDSFARTRNYDGIMSACTYATSLNPKFAAEGQHAVSLRDATWAELYRILAEVNAGERPLPISFEDLEHELPPLNWHDE